MRNVWKGLIVGGLTGAGAGTLLDLLARGSDTVATAGGRVRRYAPVAADRVREVMAAGAAQVEEAGIPDRFAGAAHRGRSTVHRGRERVGSLHGTELVHQVRRNVVKAATKGQQAASAAAGTARR